MPFCEMGGLLRIILVYSVRILCIKPAVKRKFLVIRIFALIDLLLDPFPYFILGDADVLSAFIQEGEGAVHLILDFLPALEALQPKFLE